ncbi:hypothetical protein H4R26_003815 [Coemansia thaxteri]|uniref:Thioredoxin-like fold domain-containing protein n=1 Tax=Coemansia thaxteri TaxID=2663907 RepID=A0A9W8BG26_9FUNG|nr:hypothetical protein H4R26_003815 [Coemansia thaxteri]
MGVSAMPSAETEYRSRPPDKTSGPIFLPPTPTSPSSDGKGAGTRQRAIHLKRPSLDTKAASAVPWLADKSQGSPVTPFLSGAGGGQRIRLPKRRATSNERSSSSAPGVEMGAVGALAQPATGGLMVAVPGEVYGHRRDIGVGRSSESSVPETLLEEEHWCQLAAGVHVRGTRSMSAVNGHIALCASKRGRLSHRLSHSTHQAMGARVSTSPTLPISARSRVNSSVSMWRGVGDHSSVRCSGYDSEEAAGAEMMIRLSMDASQSRGYRMLLQGDSVLSELCVLEDEMQRTVSAVQAGFGRKLVGIYFAATWSADCDVFTPLLQAVSSASGDDLVVVHVSADHHPADMERMMTGSGWLCVPWSDRRLRQELLERMEVSVSELPKLVIVDGSTHHVLTTAGRVDVERRPLTCVREWKKSRAGLSWWSQARPW